MALTISANPPELVGRERVVRATITFDSSYPTGGEAFTAAQLGLTSLKNVYASAGLGSTTTGYVPAWNRSVSSPLLLVLMGDNNDASDGPLIEVANATDLSGFVCQVEAVGF